MNSGRSDWAILRRVIHEAKAYWPHMLGIFLLSLLSVPLALLAPLPIKIVIDNVIGSRPLPGFLNLLLPETARNSSPAMLVIAAALVLAVAILVQVQGLASWLLQTYAGEGMVHHFRLKL